MKTVALIILTTQFWLTLQAFCSVAMQPLGGHQLANVAGPMLDCLEHLLMTR